MKQIYEEKQNQKANKTQKPESKAQYYKKIFEAILNYFCSLILGYILSVLTFSLVSHSHEI